MSKHNIALAGVASAVVGFFLQGCFAPQPPPECNVLTGQAVFALSNYFATLEKKGSTGACTDAPSADLTRLEVGMTRFAIPGNKQFTVAIRNSYMVDVWNGLVYSGDADGTNDCTKSTSAGKCRYCIASGTGAAALLSDGGAAAVTLSDGGVVGIVYPAGDGGTRISLTNKCAVTVESIGRVDAADPDGKNINTVANLPTYPTAGVCALSAYTEGVQNLQAEPLADGTTLPAIKLASEWSNFEIINNTKAPGTFWTANLKMTEGSCVTDYVATAFWPLVTCGVLDDQGAVSVGTDGKPVTDPGACDVSADIDAGRVTGSGLSPYFKSTCRQDVLDWAGRPVCVPTATAADLKK
jgi:hypothetical protein